jgi:predicted ArsR family transcriptional regulator
VNAYPDHPGFKAMDTAQAAAERTAPRAPELRNAVLRTLREDGPGTADEIAARLRLSILSVRPRVSELKRGGMVVDTGSRRTNQSGHSAAVFRIRSDAA